MITATSCRRFLFMTVIGSLIMVTTVSSFSVVATSSSCRLRTALHGGFLSDVFNEGKKKLMQQMAGEYDSNAVQEQIQTFIRENPVLMFSFETCPYCVKAKAILDSKNIQYVFFRFCAFFMMYGTSIFIILFLTWFCVVNVADATHLIVVRHYHNTCVANILFIHLKDTRILIYERTWVTVRRSGPNWGSWLVGPRYRPFGSNKNILVDAMMVVLMVEGSMPWMTMDDWMNCCDKRVSWHETSCVLCVCLFDGDIYIHGHHPLGDKWIVIVDRETNPK